MWGSVFAFRVGFLEISWTDFADVLLVSYLIYLLYKLMRGSLALRISVGVLALYLLYLVVKALKMELLTSILGQFIGVGVLAAIIVFQPELRRFLMLIGKKTDWANDRFLRFLFRQSTELIPLNLQPLVDAVRVMAASQTGALIVLARTSDLKFYAESGDRLDAELSKRLLLSIFYKNAPLHDGAAILQNGRVMAARCILPVSDDVKLPATLGTRHRAALGLTEITDALAVVVSEQTGQISLAHDGQLEVDIPLSSLRARLQELLAAKRKDPLSEVNLGEKTGEESLLVK